MSSDHEALMGMLTRLKLTAIRDQLARLRPPESSSSPRMAAGRE
ncbi:hypothetical protein SAMN05444161_9263 [Rhizobiales bacterium GAS191]|nr:hypothetical protein SAMN05444161_9263 [Rhizobiales bacterium GAS191]